ncbi:uncharacterized protein G2W53_000960 [Senna tora]|uniref:Uncharacterized protein n=1 Tax=Senna tora TaxID=362788 RepID=A0A834XGL5_9FABA|nr:uncharacterized protein G2W53_000960 [Senna tora]
MADEGSPESSKTCRKMGPIRDSSAERGVGKGGRDDLGSMKAERKMINGIDGGRRWVLITRACLRHCSSSSLSQLIEEKHWKNYEKG